MSADLPPNVRLAVEAAVDEGGPEGALEHCRERHGDRDGRATAALAYLKREYGIGREAGEVSA